MWDIILDFLSRFAGDSVFNLATEDTLETANATNSANREILSRLLREALERDHPEIARKIENLLRRRMNRTRNSNGNPNRVQNP